MLTDIENSKARLKSLMSKEDSIELQNTYRTLVKKLHPDVNVNQNEKTKLLWNRTVEAYRLGDIEELKAIVILLKDVDIIDIGKDFESEIDRLLKAAKDKIFKLMEYLKKIKNEFPFTIKNKIDDEGWVAKKNSAIFKKIEKIEKQKKELQQVIEKLLLENLDI